MADSPARTPPNKGKRYPPEILTPDEVKTLIRACSNRAPTGVRNRALLTVLYRGGLRIGEALALYPKDIDCDAGTVRILNGKGKRARTVGLDPAAFGVIERWLDKRQKHGLNSRHPLFSTLSGEPLKAPYVRVLLARLARRTGLTKRVHPHGLRHSHAAELAREGVPVNVIARQLGHASVATTSRYLDHIAPKEVIETMQRREWSL
jgi:site-specific recombinase XerD